MFYFGAWRSCVVLRAKGRRHGATVLEMDCVGPVAGVAVALECEVCRLNPPLRFLDELWTSPHPNESAESQDECSSRSSRRVIHVSPVVNYRRRTWPDGTALHDRAATRCGLCTAGPTKIAILGRQHASSGRASYAAGRARPDGTALHDRAATRLGLCTAGQSESIGLERQHASSRRNRLSWSDWGLAAQRKAVRA